MKRRASRRTQKKYDPSETFSTKDILMAIRLSLGKEPPERKITLGPPLTKVTARASLNVQHSEKKVTTIKRVSNKSTMQKKNIVIKRKDTGKDTNKIIKCNNNNNNNNNETSIFIIHETYNIRGVGIVFYGYVKSGCIKKNDRLIIGPFNSRFYNIYIRNVRNVLDQDTNILEQNESGCIAIKQLSKEFTFKRDHIKKGVYLTSNPYCCQQFVARIHILHHPTTIRKNYQSTIHCGSVIQAARIVEILNIKNDIHTDEDKLLRTGDQAKVKFEFMFRPEFMEDNALFIFRENNAKGVGKIISTVNI